jgi:tetratricopeptide (TPR) repeat protein
MQRHTSTFPRFAVLALVLGVGAVPVAGQGRNPVAASILEVVRTALGRATPAVAKQAVATAPASAGRELAAALIDIYEGKDDDARVKLTPIANGSPRGDAGVELGLLEMRHGRRAEGRRWLEPIVAPLACTGTEDCFRLARAAVGLGMFPLADDAFKEAATKRADVQTEWGDMYVRRHRNDLAAESYRDALTSDPAWVRAHIGMARAFAPSDPPAAEAALEAAKKLAPDHPDLWQFAAEQRIEDDDQPGTAEALDRVARARPGTLAEAALRVALAYPSSEAAVEAALARVKAIDPVSARGYLAAGQQAARAYRFEEATAFARKAVALDQDDGDAHHDLGLYLLRTGDEKTARIELEMAWSLDKSYEVTKNLLDMLDSLEKFEVTPVGDMILKLAPSEAAVLKVYAVPLLREAYQTFTTKYAFTPKGPILVEVFPVHDQFAVRTIGLPGITGALGACFGQVVSMDSPRARPPGEFSWQATAWHEMAHVFSLQMSDYRVPRWLTEGISVFEEHRRQPAWGRELTLQYAYALGRNRTFGVKGLPQAFKNPENFALAYFEASLVVEHLVELNGDEGLRTLLRAYAARATDAEAFSRAFGKSLGEVETSFRAFVDRRYAGLREALKDPPRPVDAEDLAGLRARAAAAPGNYVSQLSLGQALLGARNAAEARAPLERAAQLAPQATGNSSPRALLARIAVEAGDPDQARRQLRALLEHDHSNVVAARQLATLAAAASDADAEDFALRVIADTDPFDGDVHGKLGRRLLLKGNHAAALVEFQAALAVGPSNLAEAHTDMADALLKLNRRDEAKRSALLALKEAPTFARAQDLLLAAIGR